MYFRMYSKKIACTWHFLFLFVVDFKQKSFVKLFKVSDIFRISCAHKSKAQQKFPHISQTKRKKRNRYLCWQQFHFQHNKHRARKNSLKMKVNEFIASNKLLSILITHFMTCQSFYSLTRLKTFFISLSYSCFIYWQNSVYGCKKKTQETKKTVIKWFIIINWKFINIKFYFWALKVFSFGSLSKEILFLL